MLCRAVVKCMLGEHSGCARVDGPMMALAMLLLHTQLLYSCCVAKAQLSAMLL